MSARPRFSPDDLPEGTPAYVAPILSALEAQARLNEAWERLGEAMAAQIDQLWQDRAALRDELHGSVVALSNRIEANTPAATAAMDAIFECLPDESGGVRDGSE